MLLVLAGRIHTLDGPSYAPGALLLRRGRVVAVGPQDAVRASAGSAAVLDLGDATVTPGLTDAHVHLLEWSLARRFADLASARSPEEAAGAVRERAPADPDAWVLGRGWNPHLWGGRVPERGVLDREIPGRAVALNSHDMHALWASSEALRRAGIDAGTPDPEGGRIVRGADGEPTGLLLENATRLVLERIPAATDAERREAVLDAQAELHRFGITGVHSVEMGLTGFDSLRVFEALRAEGRLRLRILQHLPIGLLDDAVRLGLRSGFGDPWLRIGAVKMFLDGALGSRTALMREPYEGSEDRGVEVLPERDFRDAVRRAAAAGLASIVHAIGDAAVARALDVLGAPETAGAALPHRIEHVQLCPPERLADFARSGIVASMQPTHLITDWRPALEHWGRDRARYAYAFRSLLDRGAVLAFGSDVPVEPVDPRLGLYAAVSRRDLEGAPEGGWFPEERITVKEALYAYTRGPALAASAPRLGFLAEGTEADFVAWDRDPLAADAEALLELRCTATVVGGELVWRAENG